MMIPKHKHRIELIRLWATFDCKFDLAWPHLSKRQREVLQMTASLQLCYVAYPWEATLCELSQGIRHQVVRVHGHPDTLRTVSRRFDITVAEVNKIEIAAYKHLVQLLRMTVLELNKVPA